MFLLFLETFHSPPRKQKALIIQKLGVIIGKDNACEQLSLKHVVCVACRIGEWNMEIGSASGVKFAVRVIQEGSPCVIMKLLQRVVVPTMW